jgi:hypothetical protein
MFRHPPILQMQELLISSMPKLWDPVHYFYFILCSKVAKLFQKCPIYYILSFILCYALNLLCRATLQQRKGEAPLFAQEQISFS